MSKTATRRSSRKQAADVAARLRWMLAADSQASSAIAHQTGLRWSEGDFADAVKTKNCVGVVADVNGTVAGFMLYELHKHHLQIIVLAVDREFQMQGIGHQMIERLFEKLYPNRRTQINFEVPENRLAAHLFLSRCCFYADRICDGHYRFVRFYDDRRPKFKRHRSSDIGQWRDAGGHDGDMAGCV